MERKIMFNMFPDILTMDDVQKALGVGRTMAYRMISKGQIKHLRIGSSIKVPKAYLIDFVEKSCYDNEVVANRCHEEVKN